jgi:tetratricopeptide (TPR) repeat protein
MERLVEGHEERLDAVLELGDMQYAKRELKAMERLAAELRQPSQSWLVSVYHALFALLEGRFADAEALILESRRLGERAQRWNAEVTYRLQFYVLRLHTDGLAEIEALIRRSVDEYPTYAIWRCVAIHMQVRLGNNAEAEAAFDALARDSFAAVPFDEEWLVSLSLLAEVAASLSNTDAAAMLYDALRPYGDRVAISFPEISTGAVSRYLGLLAATLGRWDDARRHFEHAVELNDRIGARAWLEETRRDLARCVRVG